MNANIIYMLEAQNTTINTFAFIRVYWRLLAFIGVYWRLLADRQAFDF